MGSIRSTWTFQEGNLATSDGSHSMRLYFNQVWKCTCLAFLEVHPRKETFSVSFSFFPSSNPWQIHGHLRAVNAYCIIQNLVQIFRERSSFTLSTELGILLSFSSPAILLIYLSGSQKREVIA